MGYVFQVLDTEAVPVVFVKRKAAVKDFPSVIGEAYGEVLAYLEEIGEPPLGPAFVVYYNMDMENMEIEIGFHVAKNVPGGKGVLAGEIPGGRRASCFYKGPYSGMHSVYGELSVWMAERGLEPVGTAYEYYYNSPDEIPQEELLTKIEFTLK